LQAGVKFGSDEHEKSERNPPFFGGNFFCCEILAKKAKFLKNFYGFS